MGLFCSTTLGFLGFCGGRGVLSFIDVIVVVVGFLLLVVVFAKDSLFFSGITGSFLLTIFSFGIVEAAAWMTGIFFGASLVFEFFTCIERPKT